MVDVLSPTTPDQLRDAVGWALGSETPLEIIGSGSKRAFGHSVRTNAVLDCSKLSGILFYQPEELVISARAGTPIADIKVALAEKNQQFHFEPGNFPALLDGSSGPDAGTIGGLVACNLAGPRRIKVGAARDHLLGFEAVSGRAEDFKSGGRVMKNVTGFDLSKLMAGSFGTLGVMHTVTLKVMPNDETSATVIVACSDPRAAGKAMTLAMGSENEVSAAAWIAPEDAPHLDVPLAGEYGSGLVALRVEGPKPSVAWRADALCRALAGFGECHEVPESHSHSIWKVVANVAPFVASENTGSILWRVSVPPASGGDICAQLIEKTGGRAMMDWAGGLIWLQIAASDAACAPDAMAGTIRDIVANVGGQANLVRASDEIRQATPVFHPEDPALARINARIKENLDPKGILNPGRIAPVSLNGEGA
ncbi:glycolate oxidase subunit GlcE [Thalassospira sp. A40-3]|uniref:glycolate oxidase subunit GlcE n=1 Tax=Thalassospira sp. A40-3 TaxID=2785908 RepID=UPI0018CFBE11|nr:glycolate oxidase subunit GlcE [Thalassospira sp. A40-3]QPO11411.1 glycolate oxidase subunit GlcE [Thalassospira sp. A40-3]